MSFEILSFYDLAAAEQAEIAEQISRYTQGKTSEKPQMLPVTVEDIHTKYAGFVALSGSEFSGYVAAGQPEMWQGAAMLEVGSLWVPKRFRQQGVAHGLVAAISTHLAGQAEVPYAFCNPLSKPVFEASGYVAAQPSDIPAAAFSLCSTCPAKPLAGCCDEPMVYAGGVQ